LDRISKIYHNRLGLIDLLLSFPNVTQGTASEATLVSILAAKTRFVNNYKQKDPGMSEMDVISKLVAYCSGMTHI
jgi:hypothetical protein